VWLEDEQRFGAFDPTPFASREQALDMKQGPLGRLMEAVGMLFEEAWATFRRSPAEAFRRLFVSPVMWALIGALLVWQVLRRMRGPRSTARQRAAVSSDPRLREIYARYLRLLGRAADIAPEPAETDDELLARLQKGRGEAVAQTAGRFVEAYRQARYRGAAWEAASLEAALGDLARSLR
jgi:hypothetical protein